MHLKIGILITSIYTSFQQKLFRSFSSNEIHTTLFRLQVKTSGKD